MRNRLLYLLPIVHYVGALFWIFGFVLLIPLLVLALYARSGWDEVSPASFLLPAAISWLLGAVFKRGWSFGPLDTPRSMLVCALGWISISALGALPLRLGLDVSYLDAYFEAVSGFTTTGITMLRGLDEMPRSIIFWRALTQWVGGLGILAFFLVVTFAGGTAHQLYSAESHKIFSKRPAPGLFRTVRILWAIYAGFTLLIVVLLTLEGVSVYDAITHSFTALSTGGYSPYDASIDHYRQVGHPHFVLIEYTLAFAMLLGGINFFVHYQVLTGGIRSLWDNLEMRLFWSILGGAVVLVGLDHCMKFGFNNVGETLRYSLFQVTAIMTTTGFATKDIGAGYFPALAKQIFLVLMIVGGCVGSTGGGIKVLRIGILLKMVNRQIRRVVHGGSAVNLVVVDGDIIDAEEVRRISALFFAWMILLFLGSGITAFLSDLGPMEAASGMFSALGNIGPCYISAADMTQLHPIVKVTYILGMLAGRLEILPILLLFSRRAWK
jgi:trk system potassium uptake protein TrkH